MYIRFSFGLVVVVVVVGRYQQIVKKLEDHHLMRVLILVGVRDIQDVRLILQIQKVRVVVVTLVMVMTKPDQVEVDVLLLLPLIVPYFKMIHHQHTKNIWYLLVEVVLKQTMFGVNLCMMHLMIM